MTIIIIILGIIILCFGLVVLFGPPYLPTMRTQIDTALDLLNLQPGQTLLELGSGDGRVILAAAVRGWNVVGIELNPILALYSRIITWRYRKQVTIICGNVWSVHWPKNVDAIFTFMLQRQMQKLDGSILAWQKEQGGKTIQLASFAFYIPGREPTVKKDGVFLYHYR